MHRRGADTAALVGAGRWLPFADSPALCLSQIPNNLRTWGLRIFHNLRLSTFGMPPVLVGALSSLFETQNSLVPGPGCAGTATGATAGDAASRGSSAGRQPPPWLRTPGGLRSAAPLSSCGTGVLRALFLAKRTGGAVRPCGHRRPGSPRNPPVPFTPLGFRQSFASKLAEPNCGRCRIGFPIGTDKQKIAQMLRGPGRFRLKIKSRFSRRCI